MEFPGLTFDSTIDWWLQKGDVRQSSKRSKLVKVGQTTSICRQHDHHQDVQQQQRQVWRLRQFWLSGHQHGGAKLMSDDWWLMGAQYTDPRTLQYRQKRTNRQRQLSTQKNYTNQQGRVKADVTFHQPIQTWIENWSKLLQTIVVATVLPFAQNKPKKPKSISLFAYLPTQVLNAYHLPAPLHSCVLDFALNKLWPTFCLSI